MICYVKNVLTIVFLFGLNVAYTQNINNPIKATIMLHGNENLKLLQQFFKERNKLFC